MATVKKLLNAAQFSKEQASELVSSSSFFVKCLWSLMIFGYLLSFSKFVFYNTAIISGDVLPPNFKLWMFVTHVFVEKHIWMLGCNLVVVFLYGRLLQPLWGSLEICKFIAINSLVPAAFAVIFYTILSLASDHFSYMFDHQIYGFSGSVAGFCVAVKQIMPDQILFNTPLGKMLNRHIPLLLLASAILANMVGIVELTFPVLFIFGVFTSWVYLRFYQKHTNGNMGDSAEKFTFASFFPTIIQPVVSVPSGIIYSFLVKIKICQKTPDLFSFHLDSKNTNILVLPGTDVEVAERQRQLALRALNERLVKVPTADHVLVPIREAATTLGTGSDDSSETKALHHPGITT